MCQNSQKYSENEKRTEEELIRLRDEGPNPTEKREKTMKRQFTKKDKNSLKCGEKTFKHTHNQKSTN